MIDGGALHLLVMVKFSHEFPLLRGFQVTAEKKRTYDLLLIMEVVQNEQDGGEKNGIW